MSTELTILTIITAVLVLVAAGVGFISHADPAAQFEFTSIRGEETHIAGDGIYRHDTVFFASGFRGQDAVLLFLGVPLLLLALWWAHHDSLAGQLLLLGILAYILYVYASMALGAAFNPLFLIYVAIFSASLFAFILAFSSIDVTRIESAIRAGMSSRGLVVFMFLAGLVTLFVWGSPIVEAVIQSGAPERMDTYTTMVTYALDLAIITPATFLCAVLVLRGNSLGYLISVPLLAVVIMLTPQIVLSTLFQRAAGVPFTAGEMIGPMAGFVILGLWAAWLLFRTLQDLAQFA